MKPVKLIFGILMILLITGVGSVSAYTPDASRTPSRGVQAPVQLVPVWQQVNSNGFGDPKELEVSALEAFNGYLYAGTYNVVEPLVLFDGGRIFRSPDGVAWTPVTQPGFSNPHDTTAPAILDFVAFNGYLYASTGRGGDPGQIWRSSNGTSWSPTINYGFSDEFNVDITALAVYANKIYAGVTNSETGVQIWRSSTGDNAIGSWVKVAPPVMSGGTATRITGFAAFNGALYAALESAGAVQIWRSSTGDLNTWSAIVSNGFGDSNNTTTGGMVVFGGYLYVGAGNSVDGARLYRTDNGTNWTQAITPGFGDANNQKIDLVYVFQNRLYVSVKNTLTGIKLWRSANGTHWERANPDGFGDSHNPGSNWSNATAGFLGHLYVGTSNVLDGGELWRMQIQHLYVPLTLR